MSNKIVGWVDIPVTEQTESIASFRITEDDLAFSNVKTIEEFVELVRTGELDLFSDGFDAQWETVDSTIQRIWNEEVEFERGPEYDDGIIT